MPIVATGPSCFTHSWEDAYFKPSKTAIFNITIHNMPKPIEISITKQHKTIWTKQERKRFLCFRSKSQSRTNELNKPRLRSQKERERGREIGSPRKLKERVPPTGREAARERECRGERGFERSTRNSECIGCGRSPHSQSHVILYSSICVLLVISQPQRQLTWLRRDSSYITWFYYLGWMVGSESLILKPEHKRARAFLSLFPPP